MTPPAARLITLILMLQSQPNQKAADLAAKLDISIRTLHRYFGMLDEMGIPIYTERGPHGGFSMVRGYKMPPLIFSPEEAAAVYLGAGLVEEMWGSLYRQAARAVLAKLDNLLPIDQRQEVAWAQRSLISTGLHRSDAEQLAPTLETLRQAIRENQRVSLVYHRSGRPESQARELDPYVLVHRQGWWYVIGFCHLHQELRTFRVDRMEKLALTGQHFPGTSDFDLHAYLENEMQDQPKIPVHLRFSPQSASIARSNRSNWEQMTEQADGSVEALFNAPDLVWAASMVLAYGPGVIVLAPDSVQQTVKQWALAIAENYGG